MFSYCILRIEQQLFCYLYGGMLALFLILLSPFFFTGGGLLLVMLSVALFWGGLALYTRHTDRMRKPDVSPLVSVRDGIQVVPEPPDDDGWFLGSVHDTGDGPVCYWFRQTTKA